jgi:hypothetical protein
MCLILQEKIKDAYLGLTDKQLTDFYTHNPDGVGLMYYYRKKVRVIKALPKNAKEFITLFRTHQRHAPIVHLRMRTHGEISIANTHPYSIGNTGAYLVHNGILGGQDTHTPKMSDTWHFINDMLNPLIKHDINLIHEPWLQEMVGKYVGNNRLVIMTPDGRTSYINSDQGVVHDGIHYSNTYAWSAPQTRKPYSYQSFTQYNAYELYDTDLELSVDGMLDYSFDFYTAAYQQPEKFSEVCYDLVERFYAGDV